MVDPTSKIVCTDSCCSTRDQWTPVVQCNEYAPIEHSTEHFGHPIIMAAWLCDWVDILPCFLSWPMSLGSSLLATWLVSHPTVIQSVAIRVVCILHILFPNSLFFLLCLFLFLFPSWLAFPHPQRGLSLDQGLIKRALSVDTRTILLHR